MTSVADTDVNGADTVTTAAAVWRVEQVNTLTHHLGEVIKAKKRSVKDQRQGQRVGPGLTQGRLVLKLLEITLRL